MFGKMNITNMNKKKDTLLKQVRTQTLSEIRKYLEEKSKCKKYPNKKYTEVDKKLIKKTGYCLDDG